MKFTLQNNRRTGRTSRMIKNMIEHALKNGQPGDYYLIVSHTPEWARDMMQMACQQMHDSKLFYKTRQGNALEVKEGVVVLFRTEQWWDSPQNKLSVKPVEVAYDNVISDISLEKYIRFMESELKPVNKGVRF